MNPVGIARTELTITDLSLIIFSGLKGIHAWLGETEKGPVAEPILVGSWLEYTRVFGGLVEGNDFPLLCKRALDAGARLKISRVMHYDDITDKESYWSYDSGNPAVSSHAYDRVNGEIGAKNPGTWGNSLRIQARHALSGIEDRVDVTVTIEGSPELTQIITDVDASTESGLNDFNARSNFIKLDNKNGLGFWEDYMDAQEPLSGGTDGPTPTVIDYLGTPEAANGIYSFDNDVDITKIAVPAKAIPEIDIALAAYAERRKDLIALLRTPVGLNGSGIIDYREGTGSYSHTAVNTWYAMMFTGGLKITHPETGSVTEITALGDIAGLMTKKDNEKGEWYSFSGKDRGRIHNTLGVVYNLGSNARRAEADLVDARGVNAVIEHPTFGVVSWGNSTLQKTDTLLKKAEVAELMVFISRALKPLVEVELFNPNDVITWKSIFRRVTVFMDYIKAERAIWDYEYQGDQHIDRVEDAIINTPAGIDAGMYVFNLFVAPKVAMKYIGLRVAVTNSGVSFEALSDQL